MRFLNRLLVSGVVLILISLGFFVFALRNILVLLSPPVDLYASTDWSTLKNGTHVQTEVDFIYDYFYFNYEDSESNHTSRAYMVPNLVVEEDDSIYIKEYIGLMINKSDGYKEYDELVEDSIAWWYDDTESVSYPQEKVIVDGYLRKMKNDEKDFLVEYIMEDWEMDKAAAEEYICPYMIMPYDSGDAISTMVVCGIVFVIGLLLTGIGILIGIRRG